MIANNCFEDILQCNQEVSTVSTVSNQCKKYLKLGFHKLSLCNFSFHFLGCSWGVGGGGGGAGAEVIPRLPSVDRESGMPYCFSLIQFLMGPHLNANI